MTALLEKINFGALGFFPAEVSEERIEIANGEDKIIFDPGVEEFDEIEVEDYEGKHATRIARATRNNVWFDEFKVIRFKEHIKDPFLFGIKEGRYYFICFWDTDVWA